MIRPFAGLWTKEFLEIPMTVDDANDVDVDVVITVNDDVSGDAMKPIGGILHVASAVSNSRHGTQLLDFFFNTLVESVCRVRITFVNVLDNVSKIVQSRRRVL